MWGSVTAVIGRVHTAGCDTNQRPHHGRQVCCLGHGWHPAGPLWCRCHSRTSDGAWHRRQVWAGASWLQGSGEGWKDTGDTACCPGGDNTSVCHSETMWSGYSMGVPVSSGFILTWGPESAHRSTAPATTPLSACTAGLSCGYWLGYPPSPQPPRHSFSVHMAQNAWWSTCSWPGQFACPPPGHRSWLRGGLVT